MLVHVYLICVYVYYSVNTPLSVALSLVKVPPAHDTCVLQALAPSAKVIMHAMFLIVLKTKMQ